MKKTTCLLICICFALLISSAFARQSESNEKEFVQRYQAAYSVFQTIPYRGIFSYTEYEKDERDGVVLKIHQNHAREKKITILYPDYKKDLHILKNEKGVWGTPLSKEEREDVSFMRYNVPWHLFFTDSEIPSDRQIHLLLKNYSIDLKQDEKVYHKPADLLIFTSDYKKRPSLRLWLDPHNNMILKRRYLDYQGKPKEVFSFERIHFLGADERRSLSTESLTLIWPEKDREDEKEEEKVTLDFNPMEIEWIPDGFEKIKEDRWKDKRNERLIQTTSYSDGLAQLTIFQRKQTEKEKEKQKQENHGDDEVIMVDRHGDSIFFIEKCGLRISIVGDIHPREISKMLRSASPPKNCLK